MHYNPDIHHRRSIRLKGYDYSQPGAYFVTICTQDRACMFGDVLGGEMVINDYGNIVREEWLRTPQIRFEIQLDEFAIMPNHIHGIIFVVEDNHWRNRIVHDNVGAHHHNVGAHGGAPLRRQPKSIGSIVAGFKSVVTKRINQMRGTPGEKLWQRNYHEHIIRDENELNRIREYIINNPLNWERDENYTD